MRTYIIFSTVPNDPPEILMHSHGSTETAQSEAEQKANFYGLPVELMFAAEDSIIVNPS